MQQAKRQGQLDRADLEPIIMQTLERELGTSVFNLWFKNTRFVTLRREQAVLGVQNRFIKNWITRKFVHTIAQAIEDTAGFRPEVAVTIDADLYQASRPEDETPAAHSAINPAAQGAVNASLAAEPAHHVQSAAHAPKSPEDTPLVAPAFASPSPALAQRRSSKYRLDNFVAVKDNALPLLIARQFVESIENPLYNRLTLFGTKGNGKTHLLKAIENALGALPQGVKCHYLTAEGFTNHYVASMQSRKYNEFNARFRDKDVLILDDIQFLAGKGKTQETLLSQLKDMESRGGSVVLSADTHPGDIPGLDPDLEALLISGMVVEVKAPCQHGRKAILEALCGKAYRDFPADVIDFLAENLTSNVRDLEGGLMKIKAFAALKRDVPSINLAREVLMTHISRLNHGEQPMKLLIERVANALQVDAEEITSRKQNRKTARQRQLAMYIVRQLTSKPYKEIGEYFGGKKYSAVMYAEKTVKSLMECDSHLTAHINDIIARLSS